MPGSRQQRSQARWSEAEGFPALAMTVSRADGTGVRGGRRLPGAGVAEALLAAGAPSPASTGSAPPAGLADGRGAYAAVDVPTTRSLGRFTLGPALGRAQTVGGFAGHRPLSELDPAELTAQLTLNLVTAALVTKHALPVCPGGSGRIVQTPRGRRGQQGQRDSPTRSASWASCTWSPCPPTRCSGTGVTVNCIVPSIIDTPANRAAMPEPGTLPGRRSPTSPGPTCSWPPPEPAWSTARPCPSNRARLTGPPTGASGLARGLDGAVVPGLGRICGWTSRVWRHSGDWPPVALKTTVRRARPGPSAGGANGVAERHGRSQASSSSPLGWPQWLAGSACCWWCARSEVDDLLRIWFGLGVALTPGGQRVQERQYVGACAGQPVLVPAAALVAEGTSVIRPALTSRPRRVDRDVVGDPQNGLELFEPGHAHSRVPQDQQCPAVAEHVGCPPDCRGRRQFGLGRIRPPCLAFCKFIHP